LILFIGAVLFMFVKKKLPKNIGMIILGFGVLFIGLNMMGDAVAPLKENEGFVSILTAFDNPILAVLVGAAFTAIIQSSSAAVGVTQAFASQGIISFDVAIYIVMGMNIGTCITAVIASMSSNKASKRAALMHVVFNILGTLVFGIAIYVLPIIKTFIENLSPGDVSRQVANLHLVFNVASTILLFPFAKYMVKIVEIIIPVENEPKLAERRLVYLDKNITLTPSIAVTQASREVCRMGKITIENFAKAVEAFFSMDSKLAKEVLEVEGTINYLNHQIAGCLVHIRALDLSPIDLEKLGMMFHVISDIERIGDHAENIAEYELIASDEKMRISVPALEELREMAEKTVETINESLDIYENELFDRLPIASALEEEVDDYQELLINNHVKRLMMDKCDPRGGVMFTDMVTDLERCADHAINIAYAIQGERASSDNAIMAKQKKLEAEKERERRHGKA